MSRQASRSSQLDSQALTAADGVQTFSPLRRSCKEACRTVARIMLYSSYMRVMEAAPGR